MTRIFSQKKGLEIFAFYVDVYLRSKTYVMLMPLTVLVENHVDTNHVSR